MVGRVTVVAATPPSSVLMPTYTRPLSLIGSTTVRNEPSSSAGIVLPFTTTWRSPLVEVSA